jgi:hypothetical protein
VPILVSRSRFPILILVWNGMGRCNRADCNHHVLFRTWHFLCKRTRSSEGRRRGDIPEGNSRLVLAIFPDSDALLSCNHHSNAGSACLLNIAQEGSVELDTRIVVGCAPRLFPKLSNSGQTRKARHRKLDALTRRESSATLVGSISSMWRSLGEQVSKLAAPTPPSALHLF